MISTDDRDTAARFLEQWFPCATALLGDRADAAIDSFRREWQAGGDEHSAADAQRWMRCLHAEVARAPELPAYCADVVSFEGAMAILATSDAAARDAALASERNARLDRRPEVLDALVPVSGRNVRIERYAFDAPAIAAAIEDCDRLEGLEQRAPRVVLLVRSSVASRPRAMLISEGVAMLVELCDGGRSCAEIVRSLADRAANGGDGDFGQRALDAIEALRAQNALAYRETATLVAGAR